jgi:hypothetical protein
VPVALVLGAVLKAKKFEPSRNARTGDGPNAPPEGKGGQSAALRNCLSDVDGDSRHSSVDFRYQHHVLLMYILLTDLQGSAFTPEGLEAQGLVKAHRWGLGCGDQRLAAPRCDRDR